MYNFFLCAHKKLYIHVFLCAHKKLYIHVFLCARKKLYIHVDPSAFSVCTQKVVHTC